MYSDGAYKQRLDAPKYDFFFVVNFRHHILIEIFTLVIFISIGFNCRMVIISWRYNGSSFVQIVAHWMTYHGVVSLSSVRYAPVVVVCFTHQLPGERFKNMYELLNLRALKISQCCIKFISFNVWVRYFVWNFKGYLWNSTQNILLIHWKM